MVQTIDLPEVSIVEKQIPMVLSGQVFMKFKVLSSKITREEIKQYKKDMEEYHEQLEYNERLNIKTDIEEPTEPGDIDKATYSFMWFNMSDKYFTSFVEDYDKTNDCPTVSIEFYPRIGGAVEQITIESTGTEWINTISKLGAIC